MNLEQKFYVDPKTYVASESSFVQLYWKSVRDQC